MPISNKALAIYGILNSAQFGYRIWDGLAWSAEYLGVTAGYNVQWAIMDSCPARDEKIAILICDDGYIYVLRWDGTTGTWTLEFSVNVGTTIIAYRCAYVAYEQTSGRAVVVYPNPLDTTQLLYRIWDGSVWSAETAVPITNTTGNICFVKLASKPGSNEIALVYSTDLSELNAIIWDGTAWGNELLLETALTTTTEQCFDACYSNGTAKILMVAWSEGTLAEFQYRTWDGVAWSLESSVALSNPMYWCSIKGDPASDSMVLVYVDSKGAGGAVIYDGTAWGTYTTLDTKVETTADRCIDAEYDVNGNIVVCWGDGATLSYSIWDGTAWSTPVVITGSNDSPVVQLRRNSDGIVFCVVYDSQLGQIEEYHWDGTAWSAQLVFTASPSTTLSPYHEPYMVSPDKYIIPILETLTDTVYLTEVFTKTGSFNRLPSDGVFLTDVIQKSLLKFESLSDIIGLTDVTQIFKVFSRVLTDTTYITDVISVTEIFSRSLVDTLYVLETYLGLTKTVVAYVLNAQYPGGDSLTLTETSFTASRVIVESLSDLLSISELFSKLGSYVRPSYDLIQLSEVIIKYYLKVLAESLSITDVLSKGLLKVFTDLTTLSDVIIAFKVVFRSLTDTLYVLETYLGTTKYIVSYLFNAQYPGGDSLTLTETSFLRIAYIIKEMADSALLSEQFSKLGSYVREQHEVITISEIISRLISKLFEDVLTLTEVLSVARQITLIEVITLLEVYSKAGSYVRPIIESVLLKEVVTRTITKPFLDAVSLTEVFTRMRQRTLIDVIDLTETYYKVFYKYLFDEFKLYDIQYKEFIKSLIEYLRLVEVVIRQQIRNLADLVTTTDVPSLVLILVRYLADTLTLYDVLTKHITKVLHDLIELIESFVFTIPITEILKIIEKVSVWHIQTLVGEVSGINALTGEFVFIPQAKIRMPKRIL